MVSIGDGWRDILFNGGQLNTNFIPLWMSLVGLLGALPVDAIQNDPVNGITLRLDKIQNLLKAKPHHQIILVFKISF